jgi:hypothetical protein
VAAPKFVVIDGCPVHRDGLAPDLEAIKEDLGGGETYESLYRGQDAASILHANGKHTQAEVIQLHAEGVPGFGPANPVNGTTHCLYNDGKAYPVAFGTRLEKWQQGIDCLIPKVAAVCEAGRHRGWIVTVTYPGAIGEAQHVNFRQRPRLIIVTVNGDRGPRVDKLVRQLEFIERPNKPGVTYIPRGHLPKRFNDNVEAAVRKFEEDHHLEVDGQVGPHVRSQLDVSMQREQVRHRIDKLKVKLHNAEDAVARAQSDAQRKQQHDRAVRLREDIRKLGGDPNPAESSAEPKPERRQRRGIRRRTSGGS